MAPTGSSSFTQLGRRFSESEQMAFGRWAHLNARKNFDELAEQHLGLSANGSQTGSLSASRTSSRERGSCQLKSRRASEPNLRVPRSRTSLQSQSTSRNSSLPITPVELSAAATPTCPSPRAGALERSATFDQRQLRSVLEQLLPAQDKDKPSSIVGSPSGNIAATSTAARPLTRSRRDARPMSGSDGCTETAPRRSRQPADGTAELPPRAPSARASQARSVKRMNTIRDARRGKKQALEHFRWRLLQRFHSLFDAFERLHDLATRENSLGQEDFCQAFAQLGVSEPEALETFFAMDCKGTDLVSLAGLRIALVGTSQKALLWELRCRLLTQGITPNDFSKVRKILEIARRPRHRTVRQRRRQQDKSGPGLFSAAPVLETQCNTPEASVEDCESDSGTKTERSLVWPESFETSTGFLPSSCRLSRMDWLQVCSAIGLTLVEAERLFPILADPTTSMVDLQEMFNVLRADVAPHVSLERFATRVLTRHGSLQSAFASACSSADVMCWPDFLALTVSLDVKDSNAERLWAALALAQKGEAESTAEGKAAERAEEIEGVTEVIFVKELTTWGPRTALCALRHQVDEQFSDLGELRHAFAHSGSSLSAPLWPAELDAALLAVGIPGCDVEGVCSAVQSAWRGGRRGGIITLDDVVEALHSNSAVHGSAAQSAVRDDLRPFWKKLHNVQADLQNVPVGLRDGLSHLAIEDTLPESTLQPKRQSCCNIGSLRSSASLPSLRSSGGFRSRASRHSRRQGFSCCEAKRLVDV